MIWRNIPVLLAAGLIGLAGPGGMAAGSARTGDTPPGGDPTTCQAQTTTIGPRLEATTDAGVADFARLLHGVWVRRLMISGTLIETNSYFYFDLPDPRTGRGHAFMVDRIYQGWDRLAGVAGATLVDPLPRAGGAAPAEPETPATTGAYWSVSIRPAPASPASHGHTGVTLALAGDYRGTGPEYPPNGFRFTETGTFYRGGATYATLNPWRAPPMAAPADATTGATAFSSVDTVIVTAGGTAQPTLTFVICQDGIVDRYYKISDATPKVQGKSLRAAWADALAAGTFKAAPAR